MFGLVPGNGLAGWLVQSLLPRPEDKTELKVEEEEEKRRRPKVVALKNATRTVTRDAVNCGGSGGGGGGGVNGSVGS